MKLIFIHLSGHSLYFSSLPLKIETIISDNSIAMGRPGSFRRSCYTKKELRKIYDKTNGHCNLCGKNLSFVNYGKLSGRAPWEVDHSNPISRGGTSYLRNLYPVCPSCNRSKGTIRRRAYRKKSWLERILGL